MILVKSTNVVVSKTLAESVVVVVSMTVVAVVSKASVKPDVVNTSKLRLSSLLLLSLLLRLRISLSLLLSGLPSSPVLLRSLPSYYFRR